MMRHLDILVYILTLFSPSLFAADVIKVKGTSALIDLKGESAGPGTVYYALSVDGKRRGIIEIAKIKGDKAIGKIIKGRAEVGMQLELKGGTSTASKSSPTGHQRAYWGALLGVAQDSMKANVNVAGTNTVRSTESLTGIAFSAMGLFDYEVFPQIWFRGLAGLETLNVSGAAVCGSRNRETCNASIYYLSADFIGRYIFSMGDIRPWLGGGVALMFPASKTSTAVDSASISSTTVILVSGGVDWFISPTMYIPVSIEYGILPKSNEVETTWIELRAGLAFPF